MRWLFIAGAISIMAIVGIYLINTERDIHMVLKKSDDFQTLVTAIRKAELEELLSESGKYTLFAPTDEAFAKLSIDSLETLLNDRELLEKVLLYHISPKEFALNDIRKTLSIITLHGNNLTVSYRNDQLYIDSARLIESELKAFNGVIFPIDTLLLPVQ